MRAYLSYSISNNEHYLASILSSSLWNNGFSVDSTHGESEEYLAYLKILNSNLFIGFLSANGDNLDKVVYEHSVAVEKNIPSILLIEDEIHQLPTGFVNHNIIYFNRHNPQPAIDLITKNTKKKENKPNNAFAWLFGGAIATGLLSSMNKSKAS